ncbi:hypothetical protein [Legionella drancourtii]|jgi:hypothetical protein|uniref:Uncharacterized protein n=1 Tax=Legionella drancourtii LLAP12 TaxID=658187 RepID=G9EQC0_9GAMM|nr:hypothetical protein [Legionella drancourtii]EHL30515.1 hypothetical protein LDG_7467 [Legionella drancourtii LLAP12]
MWVLNKMKHYAMNVGLLLIHLSYAPALLAEENKWLIQVGADEDMGRNGNTVMTVLTNVFKKGAMLILFALSVLSFIKFIQTILHGIDEAKKSQGGSMAEFTNYAVMGILCLTLSIAAAYGAYTMVTKFKL